MKYKPKHLLYDAAIMSITRDDAYAYEIIEIDMMTDDIGWRVKFTARNGKTYEYLTDDESKAIEAYNNPPKRLI